MPHDGFPCVFLGHSEKAGLASATGDVGFGVARCSESPPPQQKKKKRKNKGGSTFQPTPKRVPTQKHTPT